MKKIFSYDKYSFSLNDDIISVIYNDEKIKNSILTELYNNKFLVINSKLIYTNERVSEFLKSNNFDMKLLKEFKLEEYVGRSLLELSTEDQLYIKVVVIITNAEETIIFDDILSYLSEERKKLIFKYIFNKNIKYINFTSDVEEVLFSNYLIVLSNKGVAIEGNVKSVLQEEKLLKRLGFSLPVIYDISLQLKCYGLIDKPYLDLKKLVNDLWK